MPLEKAEDFGAHANQYYPLDISYFKSSLDTSILNTLWNKYWIATLSEEEAALAFLWPWAELTRTPRGLRWVRTGYAYQPPALGTYRRRRAACPQGPAYLYVRGTRTSLRRWLRTAYRGTPGGHGTARGACACSG